MARTVCPVTWKSRTRSIANMRSTGLIYATCFAPKIKLVTFLNSGAKVFLWDLKVISPHTSQKLCGWSTNFLGRRKAATELGQAVTHHRAVTPRCLKNKAQHTTDKTLPLRRGLSWRYVYQPFCLAICTQHQVNSYKQPASTKCYSSLQN